MARRYAGAVSATNTANSSTPMFNMQGSGNFRFRVYDFVSGCRSTPTDDATNLQLQRASTAGTASTSAAGVQALEPNDPAATVIFNLTFTTTPPSLSANPLLSVSQNTRATFRWVAAPDSELICPATAAAGISLLSIAATTAKTFDWTIFWQE